MSKPIIIGLHGKSEAGKSTVAEHLIASHSFMRIKLSAPLKNMERSLLRDLGYDEETIERYIEGDLKNTVIPELGVTSRYLQLTIGTEWGRLLVHPDIWTIVWRRKVGNAGGDQPRIVTDDVRFPNEAELIRSAGGIVVVVDRPGRDAEILHESEQHDIVGDFDIVNDGTLAQLADRIDAVVEEIAGRGYLRKAA